VKLAETGGLFMLAVRFMQLFSENKADFTKLTGILGLYIWIKDDYCIICLQEVTFEVLFLDK
jgi:geranylgeranyl diphosphate synthase type 3